MGNDNYDNGDDNHHDSHDDNNDNGQVLVRLHRALTKTWTNNKLWSGFGQAVWSSDQDSDQQHAMVKI